MEKLLDFTDITLIPAERNLGFSSSSNFNFGITDELDHSISLPIFTSPSSSIVSEDNCNIWSSNGIKPILPYSLPLSDRLEGCQHVFSVFTLKEVEENFLLRTRSTSSQFKICLESGNGHNIKIFEIGKALKSMYGTRVNLMGSNMSHPKSYSEYCKSGFDYVRVGGITNGSLVDPSVFGFYYPQASLLIDTLGVKNTALTGLKHTKIISDGGIKSPVDILKAIVLGADYVMIGREFAKLLEASGPILQKSDNGSFEAIDKSKVASEISKGELRVSGFFRHYTSISSSHGYEWPFQDARSEYVKITNTLKSWLEEMYKCFTYGFMFSNAKDWKTFKNNARYVKVQL